MYVLTPKKLKEFWSKVRKIDNGCWEWTGSCYKSGYGRIFIKCRAIRAHKISFYLHNSELNEKNIICHKCDNTRCVNPDHLWAGTSKENTVDMMQKGRLIRNRSKHKDSISNFPGISFRKEKKSKQWRARIMRNYQTIWCQEFENEQEAHLARVERMSKLNTY